MKKNDNVYRKINRIPYRYIPIMVLTSISINILSLALPLTMKQIYSKVIINKSVETLELLMLGCVIALGLEALLRKIKDSSSKWISAKYEHQLSTFLMRKILNSFNEDSEMEDYNANLEKFNSISRVTMFYSTSFYQIFIDLPFMLFFLYLILYLGDLLVLVPISLSIIYILIMIVNSEYYFKNREAQVIANDEIMSELTETLEKIHLVKAAGLEEFQITKYRKALEYMTESDFRTDKFKMIPQTLSSYFSQLTLFSILVVGGYLMIQGRISFGEITACGLLGSRAIAPVQSIMNLYLQRKDIRILKERLDQIASQPNQYLDDVPIFPDDISGTIEIMNLKYKNIQNYLYETLSCQIKSGSFVHINPMEFLSYRKILNKIIGKEKIESGKVLIDNLDITEWNMSTLRGKIEYLSDHVSIFKGSIMDNITYFDYAKIYDAYEAAAITGLDLLVTNMSEGFETQIDSQAVNYLSSAFMQRLNLTRALLVRPRILIVDRIDESMDYETLEKFIWLLGKFKGKLTIIIATENQIIKDMADHDLNNLFD